jgi:predicted  nucleic acid-binding Zn-ribbon protein
MRTDFERAESAVRRLEFKLCNQASLIAEASDSVNSASKNGDLCINLRFNIEKLLFQLTDIENELKQAESEMSSLRAQKLIVEAGQSTLNNRDLQMFLGKVGQLVDERRRTLADEVHARRVLLNSLFDSVNAYETRFRTEVKWFHGLDSKIDETTRLQHSSSDGCDEVVRLKEYLNPVAVRLFAFVLL